MNVSPSTMRRRLEAEFTSYQGLKDQVRRDAAIYLLCATDLTIADIAAQVGFDEPSAFKTWCGVRPRAYLSRHRAP
jgi:AraC-like DNA-binding protein